MTSPSIKLILLAAIASATPLTVAFPTFLFVEVTESGVAVEEH
jgi:hypothetical protein